MTHQCGNKILITTLGKMISTFGKVRSAHVLHPKEVSMRAHSVFRNSLQCRKMQRQLFGCLKTVTHGQLVSNIALGPIFFNLCEACSLGTRLVTPLPIGTNFSDADTHKSDQKYYYRYIGKAPRNLRTARGLLFSRLRLSRIIFWFLQLQVNGGLLYM